MYENGLFVALVPIMYSLKILMHLTSSQVAACVSLRLWRDDLSLSLFRPWGMNA
jgi:hypothetical protein